MIIFKKLTIFADLIKSRVKARELFLDLGFLNIRVAKPQKNQDLATNVLFKK